MDEPPPERLMSPDGTSGWFAFAPAGTPPATDDAPWERPPPGSVIRLMGEYGVDVPLWSLDDGLMFATPEELVRELGVSPGLAERVTAWGVQWEDRSGEPEHDAEAERLVASLAEELHEFGYRFVYQA